MENGERNNGMPNPLPESCRICTRYLNEVLPEPSCYISCPKNDPIRDISASLSLNIGHGTELEECPKCSKRALFWNKAKLIYECLNPQCMRTFTIATLKSARVNAQGERKYPPDVTWSWYPAPCFQIETQPDLTRHWPFSKIVSSLRIRLLILWSEWLIPACPYTGRI
jgi:hypothetical protein